MSQYKDSAAGRGGGGGGGGGRNREESEERVYRGREEDDDESQYSPEMRYGFGAVPIPDIDSRSSNRPTQQPRRPLQPMSSRQGGQGVPIPPVPRAPSNSSRGAAPPPPRPSRPSYVPSNLDPSEVQEVRQNPNFSYRLNHQPVKSQSRYSQQSEDDDEFLSPNGHPSVSSSRSIFIGFDPNPPAASAGYLGPIPTFPPVPPPIPSAPNRKSLGTNPPPSARRGTSSYYSQQTLMVSPIPEEPPIPLDRHGSYASSAAIPSSWDSGPIEFYSRDDFLSDSDEYESEMPIDIDVDIEDEGGGLVRQASLGRKSRPVITEIKSPGGLRGGSKSSSTESFKTSRGINASRSPASRSSPTLNPVAGSSISSLPIIRPGPQARSPASSTTSSANSPNLQPPIGYATDGYGDDQFVFPRRMSGSPGLEKEMGYLAPPSPWEMNPTAMKFPPPAAGGFVDNHAGRRVPPRLNLDAVREAEARGSLTSLPDLIRRATKLAAVLETGRPDSRWGMRGSFMGNSFTSRSNRRDTDSISDILASFPPPALAQGKQRPVSGWPLPGDFNNEKEFSVKPPRKQVRRLCGLPVWAFVLLVIVALVVISAAVIIPLVLVNLYKEGKNDSSALAECKKSTPCLNGGETVSMTNFCGCVCTNGFTGSNCSVKADASCTTVDLKDGADGSIKGIRNVTMGNALPRLFEIADPFYNIPLDMATVMAVFSKESISCTAQNALVTFNGIAVPPTDADDATVLRRRTGLRRRQNIVIDTSDSSPATNANSASNRVPQLDQDAIDFARVAVLFLTNSQTLKVAVEAQTALQNGFTAGKDFGSVSIGNNITVNFDNRSIKTSGGKVVGSVTVYNSTTTPKRAIVEAYLRGLLSRVV